MKLIYLTWDGPDHTYLESLFFPIFRELSARGIHTHVVQFSWEISRLRDRLETAALKAGVGIELHEIPRRPLKLATALAISWGAAIVARATSRLQADVVMPRSHITAGMAVMAHRFNKVPVVWDSDGLVADERADFGGWSRQGLTYRIYREIELDVIRRARKTITRTNAAARILQARSGAPTGAFCVVPNGKNPTQFSPGERHERAAVKHSLGIAEDAPLLTFVGSIGPQYHLPETLEVFAQIRSALPSAHLLLLADEQQAQALVAESRIPPAAVTIRRVPPESVAGYLRAADAGFAFRSPSLSMLGVCPIKVTEYLLSGVPVLANKGIGDLDDQLSREVGFLADDLGPASLEKLATTFVQEIWPAREIFRTKAREVATSLFTLDTCADGYAQAIRPQLELEVP